MSFHKANVKRQLHISLHYDLNEVEMILYVKKEYLIAYCVDFSSLWLKLLLLRSMIKDFLFINL